MKKPKQKNRIKPPVKKKKKAEKHKLKHFLHTAGMEVEPKKINKIIIIISIIFGFFDIIYLIIRFASEGYPFGVALFISIILTPFLTGLMFLLLWLIFLFYLDMRTFNRKEKIEAVLPDFLQLIASNIRAGMPIDQSLWFAIRPRFGILAKEIEIVAKEVMSGNDLGDSLKKFADKYDSMVVQRSISLLLVGMEAGGEIGELLNQISVDIQENRLMRKEMSANVQTYVIFISFSTIVAAPILMGLSMQLLVIVKNLVSNMDFSSSAGTGIGITPGGSSITAGDFRIFAITVLTITSFVSSMLIAIIKKGNVKSGLKYIPIYIVSTVILFLLASWVFGFFLSALSI